MAAKEHEEDVPATLLQHQQVPTPPHTLLGVAGIHHTSLFCVRLFSYNCSLPSSLDATFPVDSQGYHGAEVTSLLNSHQLRLQYTFRNFQLLPGSFPVQYKVQHSHSNWHF